MTKTILSFTTLLLLSTVYAHDDKNLKVKTIVKSTKSWDGQTLKPYAQGQPEVTILEIEIPPKTKLPVHKHSYMNAGVLIEGTLKVVTNKNEVLILKKGDPIVEVIDKWHYGINEQDTPAKIIVFYAGIKDQPTTVKKDK